MYNTARQQQPISRSLLSGDIISYQAADVTRNNTTTLSTLLTLNLASRGIYAIRSTLFVSVANATPLIKVGIVTVAAQLTYANINIVGRFEDPTPTISHGQLTSLTTISSVTSAIGLSTVDFRGTIEVTVGGPLLIQGAQLIANASDTIFQRGSFVIATKLN